MRPLWTYLAQLQRLTPPQQQQQQSKQQCEQQQRELASAQPPTDSASSTTAATSSSSVISSSSSSSSSDEHRAMLRRFIEHAGIDEDYGRAAVAELCKMAAQLCSAEIRQRCAATEHSLQQQAPPPDTKGSTLLQHYTALCIHTR
jgi:E3 ubiquitin-protein ligase DOA10